MVVLKVFAKRYKYLNNTFLTLRTRKNDVICMAGNSG